MTTPSRNEVIETKIKEIKAHGGHAIKVELEAQFSRRDDDEEEDCGYCDEGAQRCGYCDDGRNDCGLCDTTGEIRNPEYRTGGDEPLDMTCPQCDGDGNVECDSCDGSGGVTCSECDGNWEAESSQWSSNKYCHNYLMEKLSHLGLTEQRPGECHYLSHSGIQTDWYPVAPLVYAEFYRDGSVDSELTFTLMIDDEKTVFLIPKVMDIWKGLGDDIGNGMDVSKAGMHTAIIFDENGLYPSVATSEENNRFKNFQKSMTLLLPALYFLGSGSSISRGLEYRQPRIAARDTRLGSQHSYYDNVKYSAVFWNGRALEYRLFETCYDNPDQILDNIVVIANTLRYWTDEYRPSGLAKVTREVKFGVEGDNNLERLYVTGEHLDLLNAGLNKLKPSYLTIRAAKQQRSFKVDKRKLNNVLKFHKKQAEGEYKEYAARFEWNLKYYRQRCQVEMLERFISRHQGDLSTIDEQIVMTEVDERAEQYFRENYSGDTMDSAEQFVAKAIERLQNRETGRFTLREEAPAPESIRPRPTMGNLTEVVNFITLDEMPF